jgi:hypothetical protein
MYVSCNGTKERMRQRYQLIKATTVSLSDWPQEVKYFMVYCAKFDLDTGTNNTKSAIAEATLIEDDDEEEVEKTQYLIPWIPLVKMAKKPFSMLTPQWGSQENDQCHVIPNDDDENNGELYAKAT